MFLHSCSKKCIRIIHRLAWKKQKYAEGIANKTGNGVTGKPLILRYASSPEPVS
jgi:hypothetical protein